MKIAMLQEKGEQPKSREHFMIVNQEEGLLLIVMANDYCEKHKQSKKAKKILKEMEDNLCIY